MAVTESCYAACYTDAESEKISQAIVDLAKCKIESEEQRRLINEQLLIVGPKEGRLFWQDPMWVGGGMVVSFSLGVLLVFSTSNR